MDKEWSVCKINTILFKKEWEQLEKYYKKKHTRDDANFYYSKLKDLTDREFEETIDLVFKKCKYFPNIAEIRELLPKKDKTIEQHSEWENATKEPLSKEDEKCAINFYKKYCDTEEEYQERIERLKL